MRNLRLYTSLALVAIIAAGALVGWWYLALLLFGSNVATGVTGLLLGFMLARAYFAATFRLRP